MKKHFLLIWFVISCLGGALTAQTVYITNTGQKYHKEYCRYLSHSKKAIALAEAVRLGYIACKICKPGKTLRYNKQKNVEQERLYGVEVVSIKEDNKVFKYVTNNIIIKENKLKYGTKE